MASTEKDPEKSDRSSFIPAWAKHVVWYQLFPERFRNGDPQNDPVRERVGGPEGWEISPWTGDWYKRAPWERSMGKTFRSGVFHRRYGGDIQGIIDKLDYIQDLGVGAIYLNPIFDAVSLHKYDASCYHHVDRFFGPDPEGDMEIIKSENPNDPSSWQWTSADKLFLRLIQEVHKRGMKIIIDGVFNHTGTDFWAFQDVREQQQESSYKDWYAIKAFNDPQTSISEFEYSGWWGFKGLPEFKERDDTLVKPVRDHIFAVTQRWMDPNNDGDPSDGVDGWRLDVPEEVGEGFWEEWCSMARRINPQAYLVGEIWTKESVKWIGPRLFSAAMNYPFMDAVQEYMINESISTQEFIEELEQFRKDLPSGADKAIQNLVESHDTPRIASMVVNPGRPFDEKGKPSEGFKVRKPTPDERRLQKLIALFQFTYVGSPMLYYGTEAGMWGATDPDDRKPMLWKEYDYEPEAHHPLGKARPADENNFDPKLFNWYRKLAQIRNAHRIFQIGEFNTLLVKPEEKVFAFARATSRYEFGVVAINRSVRSRKINVPLKEYVLEKGTHLENLLTGTRTDVNDEIALITLPPLSAAILIPESIIKNED